MTTIYIAGASAEIERCEAFRDACRAMGYTVTFDWMANIRRVGAANEGVTDEDARQCRTASDDGVDGAAVFVLLLGRSSFGAAHEFGYARACDRWRSSCCETMGSYVPTRFLVVGEHASVFLRDTPSVATDAEALDALREMVSQ